LSHGTRHRSQGDPRSSEDVGEEPGRGHGSALYYMRRKR
jgi:hypothetical protein